jgi:hypothetical protein
MTSFHIPTEEELRAEIAALAADPPNVLRFPIQSATTAAQNAVALSEMNRKLSLEAAASFVEILRDATATAPPSRVTPERMTRLLTEVAKAIRELKQPDASPAAPNGGAA